MDREAVVLKRACQRAALEEAVYDGPMACFPVETTQGSHEHLGAANLQAVDDMSYRHN
jgi:hypothetical protein